MKVFILLLGKENKGGGGVLKFNLVIEYTIPELTRYHK